MRGERFERGARVVAGSAGVRAVLAVDAAIRTAWTRSRVAATLRRWQALAAKSAAERVRLTGVVMLTAAIVHVALRPRTSPAVRSTAPHALSVPVIALGIVMIVAAPAIARAWPRSRLCRWARSRASGFKINS